MTRDIGSDFELEIAKTVLNPFYALHIDLGDPVYAWSGIGTITFGGHEWDGVGSYGGYGSLTEASDGTASQMTFLLSGIDQTFYTYLVEQPYRNALCQLWVGALDEGFTAIVAGPLVLYQGRLTAVDLVDGAEVSIQITVERSSRDQTRQRVRRYSDYEQQRRYPADKFFEYCQQMQTVTVLWGREG